MKHFDVVIVGAGIAGASLAAAIAPTISVLLLEAEDLPGRHATGRSAAFWSETYGGPFVQPLTTASESWFRARGLLAARGALYLARAADEAAMAVFRTEFEGRVRLDPLPIERARAMLPGLSPDWVQALFEPTCTDIDVSGSHQACLAEARRNGAVLACASPLRAAERTGGAWRLRAGDSDYAASILVNAAGAWADAVAELAGVAPIGITPLRRTMVQIEVSPPAPADLPLVMDMEGSFYLKPQASGRLWLSPHDETQDAACDAAPDELDVAIAIDRFERALDWPVVRLERKWAGLRSFVPDRLPVYGFDPAAEGFFWCAGQGGFGIQTAPAAAGLAAALLTGHPPAPSVAKIDPAPYLPDRFR